MAGGWWCLAAAACLHFSFSSFLTVFPCSYFIYFPSPYFPLIVIIIYSVATKAGGYSSVALLSPINAENHLLFDIMLENRAF